MILFLDFDGVLHPESLGRTEADWLFCRLPLLHAILRALPEAQVVLSTSWRLIYPREELVDMVFSEVPNLAGRFAGCTPDLDAKNRVQGIIGQRQDECVAWLEQAGRAGGPWLALDDCEDYFWPGCRELYRVDHRTGLTEKDVPSIIERLGR
ncbi:MAG: HAD domain-containing protein [Rhodocyclaceae bacterium]|nr:HAD domain-containing protein [Rhodocyclaceae bacterium]